MNCLATHRPQAVLQSKIHHEDWAAGDSSSALWHLLMDTPPESPQPQAVGELERCRRELERADQVLACLRRALGHDMANHLVAIEGLLRILEMEEGEHFGAAGKDYVRRIGNVTERVHTLVSSLAEICRGRKDAHLAERLSLTGVAQEVAAEL